MQWPFKNEEELEQLCSILTRIAGLPFTEEAMKERQLIVTSKNVAVLIKTLHSNDARLQCKAANAIGSICMCKQAGQVLINQYGIEIIKILKTMLMGTNYWSQGDSCFVLGWIIKLPKGDDENNSTGILEKIEECIPIIIQQLKNYIPKRKYTLLDQGLMDKQENYRIYGMICLINAIQENPLLLEKYSNDMNHLILHLAKLLKQSVYQCQTGREMFRPTELLELVPLMASLLYVMIQKSTKVLNQVLALKMLPILIQLEAFLALESLDPLIQYIVAGFKIKK